MKKIFISICLVATVLVTNAQTSFRKFLPVNTGYSNTIIDVKRANDGGYLVLQTRLLESAFKSDVLVTKFNSKGDSLWSSSLNGQQLDGGAAAIDIYPNNGSMFVGFLYQNGSKSNTGVGHLDKDGILIGGSVHTFDLNDEESISSLTQTDDGGFVMTVNARVQNGSYSGWIVKVKNDFTIEWQKEDSFYTFSKVIKQSLGSYVCVGIKASGGCKMVKYSSVGNKLWEKIWPAGELYDVCEVANNDLVAVGYGGSFQVVKVSNTGVEQWKKNYYGTGSPLLYPNFWGVARTLDDQLIFSGSNNNGTTMDYFLAKSDNTGKILWTKSFGSNNRNINTHFNSVERTPDGGYITTANYDQDNNGFNEQGAFYKTDDKGQVANLSTYVQTVIAGKPIVFDDGKGGQGSITFTKLGNIKNAIIKVYGDSLVYNASTAYTYINRFVDIDVLGASGYEAVMKFIFYNDELNGLKTEDLAFLHYVATLKSWESFVPSSLDGGLGSSILATLSQITGFSPWTMGKANTGNVINKETKGIVTLYPVPASGQLYIESDFKGNGNLYIELLDITGRNIKVIYDEKCPAGQQTLTTDVSGIKPGIYFCRIIENNSFSTVKITIE